MNEASSFSTKPFYHSINGQLVEGTESFDVFNPANDVIVGTAPSASKAQVDEAIAAAKAAQKSWGALSQEERGAFLNSYADALEQNKDELITLLTAEQGKPRHSMATGEIERGIKWIRGFSKRRLPDEILEDSSERTVRVSYTPLGVVGAITPWNFPILLAIWKIAPALLMGNTMVLKPSPYTPLGTLRLGEIAQEIFPAGVLNVVSGENQQGAWITEHPDVAKISFTGSTATGKKIMAASAGSLKRVTLELGGNDPAIILPGTDYASIIPKLFYGAYGNLGQWCTAIKRLYVHDSLYEDFMEKFVSFASTQVVGDGMDPSSDLGPVQNKMQYEKLQGLLSDIKKNNFTISLGGTVDEEAAGNFVPVTIVGNPSRDSRIVREEQFGPILPVLRWTDLDDVVEEANNSEYGLAASVWGPDQQAATEVAERLEAGTVWINEIHNHSVDIPFGGHKQSGLGVENGVEGLKEYTNVKTYSLKK